MVSRWKVEEGAAIAEDVALATDRNRLALQGGLDFVDAEYDEVFVAVVDANGCARVRQRIRGPFGKPVVEKPNVRLRLRGRCSTCSTWRQAICRESAPGARCSTAAPWRLPNSMAATTPNASATMSRPAVAVSGDGDELALAGALDIMTLGEARAALKRWSKRGATRTLDIAELANLDTPGALFLCGLRDRGVVLTGIRAEHQSLLDLVCGLDLKPLPKVASVPEWRQFVIQVGKGAHGVWHETIDIITFVGRAASWTVRTLVHPGRIRPASISRHVADTGIKALPIVGLMAVMIAVVIGYQGVAQLRPYGGEDFTINLVAVSVLREMGVLITAIMVAGLGRRIRRRDRRHADARGSRCAPGDGDGADAGARGAADHRAGHHPAAARVLRGHHGPGRRRRHFPFRARYSRPPSTWLACRTSSTEPTSSSASPRRPCLRSASPPSVACTGCG